MNVTKLSLLFVVLISIQSCDKKIVLNNFKPAIWMADFDGCKGDRKLQLPYLNEIKKQFVGMRETQLHQYLGKANRQELKERNCKSYFYFCDKGNQCQGMEISSKTPLLIVELDALNRVMLLRYAFE